MVKGDSSLRGQATEFTKDDGIKIGFLLSEGFFVSGIREGFTAIYTAVAGDSSLIVLSFEASKANGTNTSFGRTQA